MEDIASTRQLISSVFEVADTESKLIMENFNITNSDLARLSDEGQE